MKLKLSFQESNALKGIALILLLIHHLFYIQNGQYDDIIILNHGIVNTLGILCKACVALFVFLSGYGLGLSITASRKSFDIKKFYIKRFSKLFLNYWFIWLLFVPPGIIFFGRSFVSVYGEHGWIYGILDFLGLLNITGRLGYNPTWWFYSCIILLYLIFPIIALTISKWPKTIWLFLVISIIIVKSSVDFINPIRYYLLPFITGILFSNSLITNKLPPHATTSLLSQYDTTSVINAHNFSIIRDTNIDLDKRIMHLMNSVFCGTLGIGGILVLLILLITAWIVRLNTPYALLWDSFVAVIIVLLYKNVQNIVKIQKGLEFIGKHSFNIFLFHTFIYYLYFPFLIYWSRNPIIIFISLLLSSIAVSLGIEKCKGAIGFYRLYNKIINRGK